MTDKEFIKTEIERLYRESYDNAPTVLHQLMDFINSLPEEPISKDLEEAALEYANNQLIKSGVTDTNCPRELAVAQASLMANGFRAGAKWQKEVFEKNRLAACDRATKEEIEREQDFVDKVLIGEQRQPTFSDAIEYGIKWQKTKSIVDTCYHLEMRLPEYLDYNGTMVEGKDFIDDFRKALEED